MMEWTFSYLDIALDATYYYDLLACDILDGRFVDAGVTPVLFGETAAGTAAAAAATATAEANLPRVQHPSQQPAPATPGEAAPSP